jgi:hypothetical protein
MHDLDRTQNLFESDYQEMEFEYDGQSESEGAGQYPGGSYEASFDEVDEMELAAELLEVTDEYELDQFLGSLLKKAKKAAGGFLKSSVGQHIGGLLKSAAKAALPAIGNIIAPGVGGAAASQLGSVFGLELEGLSPQDQEFEEARQFVRFAGEVAKNAAEAPPNAPPQQVAQNAVVQAAQKHAPGLLRATNGSGNGYPEVGRQPWREHRHHGGGGGGGRSGRWVRRGNKIILLGV